MTEELEGTLREAVESHLDERLRSIKEDLSRLQEEFHSVLTRLRGSSGESLAGTPIETAIAQHLEAARAQGSQSVPAPAPATEQFTAIKNAVADIENQRSQVSILNSLLSQAAQFANRAALFVIKGEHAVGWRMQGPEGSISDENMRDLVLPLTSDTLLSYVARSRATWSGEPGSNSEDSSLLEELGASPQWIAAIPLVVRGRTVAVIYADTESPDPDAINLQAIETLVLVAAMAVNLLSVSRVATRPVSAAASAQPDPEQAPAEAASAEPAAAAIEPISSEIAAATAPKAEPVVDEPVPAPVAEEEAAPAETPAITTEPMVSPAIFEPPAPVISSGPSFGSEYAAPLGTSRRWGQADAELPIEVGEDERRFHTDARRFARLLVSEIKLYNEQKVKEGQSHGDIYERLREDIDRSRQMYEKRIAPPVAERYDYFHHELVNSLAGGDSAKLGAGYPGASVAVA